MTDPARRRPEAVAFDVNETLIALDRLGDAFEDAGLPGPALDLWFARTLKDGFALAATGDHESFSQLARYHLRRALRSFGLDQGDATVDRILGALHDLEPYADAEPALRRLDDAGVRVVTVTNGSADTTRELLEQHGLAGLVERCIGVDEVSAWKPRPEPYRAVLHHLGMEPEAVALVAVHSWDIHGASRAGLTTAWVSRLEGERVPGTAPADVTATNLVEAVEGLLALPA